MKVLIFILSPTANGGCEVLTLSKSNGKFAIPCIEATENAQSEILKFSQNLLNIQNVELLSYLGSEKDLHAYILRTIKAQVEPEQLSSRGCQFNSLNRTLNNRVQVEAQAFWSLLMDYIQEYMVWE